MSSQQIGHELIGRIKDMNEDYAKFVYRGGVFPWRGKSKTVIGLQDCIFILIGEGWTEFQYAYHWKRWYAKRPDGVSVTMDIGTMRSLAVHAVYDYERKIKQNTLDRTANR